MPSENEKHREPIANEGEERAEDVEQHSENGSHASQEGKEDGKKKDKYDRSGPHPIIGLIVFAVLQFIALLFMVVATPIEMFTINNEWRDKIYPALAGGDKKLCVTAWGMKAGCRTKGYYNRDFTNTFCYRFRTDFKIVEAFCIMTISFMAFALLCSICSIFQKVGKGSTGAVGAFAMLLCLIPWGVLAGMFWQKPCCETENWNLPTQVTTCGFSAASAAAGVDVPRVKDMGSYGAGFGLIVTAWCLQVIACVFAFAPI